MSLYLALTGMAIGGEAYKYGSLDHGTSWSFSKRGGLFLTGHGAPVPFVLNIPHVSRSQHFCQLLRTRSHFAAWRVIGVLFRFEFSTSVPGFGFVSELLQDVNLQMRLLSGSRVIVLRVLN